MEGNTIRVAERIVCPQGWLSGQAQLEQNAPALQVSGSSPRRRSCPSPPVADKIAGLAIAGLPGLRSADRPLLLCGRDRHAPPPNPGSQQAAEKHARQKIVTG